MDVIVDTSVLIAVVTNEPTRPRLIELTTGVQLIAPASVPWEVGNAFSAMLKRKRASLEQVKQALHAYQQIPVRYVDVDLERALTLAAQYELYAYDAYFLVCALQQTCSLLTLDSGLRHAALRAGISIMEVGS
jgi:predicted nucleic acid-binding protein